MSILGKCPYCGANVISRKFNTKGKTIKLYSCENAKKSMMKVNNTYLQQIQLVLLEYTQMPF